MRAGLQRRRAAIRGLAAAAALLAAACAPAAAEEPLTLDLIDPSTAQTVRVTPGGPALHLVFFATWCTPCLAELGRLADLEARWSEGGYRLVLIAVSSRQSSERLARFAAQRDLPGELLFDADGAAQRRLAAEQLPTHVLLDRAGREVLRAGSLEPAVAETVARLVTARSRGARP